MNRVNPEGREEKQKKKRKKKSYLPCLHKGPIWLEMKGDMSREFTRNKVLSLIGNHF